MGPKSEPMRLAQGQNHPCTAALGLPIGDRDSARLTELSEREVRVSLSGHSRSPTKLRSAVPLCRLTSMSRANRDIRVSLQTLRVLEVFLTAPAAQLSGAEVQRCSGLASGTLYPILLRLESAGWFVSRWETIDPASAGRPRRRLYRLTPSGLARASEVFASFSRGVPA